MHKHLLVLTFFALTQFSCAVLHHVQVGEIDNRNKWEKKQFDIKVNEYGFNLEEAGRIARALSGSQKTSQTISQIQFIVSLFQWGPRTGNATFTEDYARKMIDQIQAACPSGQVTGLNSIREMRKYPVISGELVKITGYCLTARNQGSTENVPKKKKKS